MGFLVKGKHSQGRRTCQTRCQTPGLLRHDGHRHGEEAAYRQHAQEYGSEEPGLIDVASRLAG